MRSALPRKTSTVVVGLERVEPAVLEVAACDRPDVDVLAEARDAGPEHADRARADLDPRALLGGRVELVDDVLVRQGVHLQADAARLSVRRRLADRANPLDQPGAQAERGHQDLLEVRRAAEAGQVVEEEGDVVRDLGVCRVEAHVLVGPGRDGVVVPRAHVHVTAERVSLAADDKRHLRVHLQIREAVDHVDAGLLERPGPLDVPVLVEARLQLHEADALFAVLGALDEAGTSGLSPLVLYTAVFIAITSGSRAAARTKASKLAVKDSYGWWTRMSFRRISSKRSRAVVREPDRGRAGRRRVLEVGPVDAFSSSRSARSSSPWIS